MKKSEQFKNALSGDVNELKEVSKDAGKSALIGGGIVLGGFILYKLFSSSKENEEAHKEKSTDVVYVNPPSNNSIFNTIMSNISMFLLQIAKEKLMEFMKEKKEPIE